MSVEHLDLQIYIHGVEDVNSAFKEISDNASQMGDSFKDTALDLLLLSTAARGIVHLTEAFGMLNEEQSKSLSLAFEMISVFAAVLRVVEMLSTAEWALTVAKKARAIASAIASAVETGGLSVPIIAAASIAAAVAVTVALATMPAREMGGPIFETGPYMLHKDEYVLTAEQTRELITAPTAPITRMFPTATAPVKHVTYVNINYPVFRSRSDMEFLVDRLKRMGQA